MYGYINHDKGQEKRRNQILNNEAVCKFNFVCSKFKVRWLK